MTTDLAEAVSAADLVIENAREQPELKRELFARLDRLSPPHAVLAHGAGSTRARRGVRQHGPGHGSGGHVV